VIAQRILTYLRFGFPKKGTQNLTNQNACCGNLLKRFSSGYHVRIHIVSRRFDTLIDPLIEAKNGSQGKVPLSPCRGFLHVSTREFLRH